MVRKGVPILRVNTVYILHTLNVNIMKHCNLTFSTLWANSADDKFMIFCLIFPKILEINLHEMSKPVFLEK